MCSPCVLLCFGTMRLAYLLQAAWAICVRLCTLQLHAQMPQWLPAWQIGLLIGGFFVAAPSWPAPRATFANERSWTARGRLPLRRSIPYAPEAKMRWMN